MRLLFIFYFVIFITANSIINFSAQAIDFDAPSIIEYKNIGKGLLLPKNGNTENKANESVDKENRDIGMKEIARLYAEGNFKEVKKYIVTFADNGIHEAEELLGIMYKQGQGIPADSEQAVIWLTKAANANQPLAQHHLGVMYYTGEGVRQDFSKSLLWLRLASIYYQDLSSRKQAKKDYEDVLAQTSRRDKSRAKELISDWLERRNETYLLDMQE